MSSCPCYKSKLQFDESLKVEHLLINIHSHNSGIVLASKLEEISQKLVLGWVQFRAVPEVVWRILQIEEHDQRSNKQAKQNKIFFTIPLAFDRHPDYYQIIVNNQMDLMKPKNQSASRQFADYMNKSDTKIKYQVSMMMTTKWLINQFKNLQTKCLKEEYRLIEVFWGANKQQKQRLVNFADMIEKRKILNLIKQQRTQNIRQNDMMNKNLSDIEFEYKQKQSLQSIQSRTPRQIGYSPQPTYIQYCSSLVHVFELNSLHYLFTCICAIFPISHFNYNEGGIIIYHQAKLKQHFRNEIHDNYQHRTYFKLIYMYYYRFINKCQQLMLIKIVNFKGKADNCLNIGIHDILSLQKSLSDLSQAIYYNTHHFEINSNN
ncbi:Hypothetical_protein [Hexamita inflata]|uniref:Hypothetical_protein n=1 Tax=Hexamita inflata TaxID=28002 RepID=A0AA86QKU8_9EUKA|nr:Hypothetical protein HINF_LOCUS43267 [Hexamita inflata]